MDNALQLELVTPDRTVVSQAVDYVGVPGLEGQFGVLPQHIPMLAAIVPGELYFRIEGKTHYAFVSGGFADVSENIVTILAESSELASDIDTERATEALERAKQRLENRHHEEIDLARAELALLRAIKRLHVASMS